jgi:hypothetical protein
MNAKQASITEIYEGPFEPEKGSLGEPVKRIGKYEYSFYIANDMYAEFDYPSVKGWFATLMKDTTIIQKKYVTSNDSFIYCAKFTGIKHQYKPFIDISFSQSDFLKKGKGKRTLHYIPIRVTFSKVLYTTDNRALVFAKVYEGMGRGNDQWVYGYIFTNRNNKWILSQTEGEIR